MNLQRWPLQALLVYLDNISNQLGDVQQEMTKLNSRHHDLVNRRIEVADELRRRHP